MRFVFLTLMSLFSSASLFAEPIKVVASFSILGDMVKTIGGEQVEVTTIVGPNQDTHVYEPRPQDAINMANADMVFINGLGFEGWMERLVEASGFKGKAVIATSGLRSIEMEEKGKVIDDPHAWHNPDNALIYVKNIKKALIAHDPDNKEVYEKRALEYLHQIKDISTWAREELSQLSTPLKKVITAHDAFGYMARAYNIKFMAPVGLSTESEPSAKTIANILKQIRETGIRAVFIENISNPRIIQQISDEAGIQVTGVLYSDALSEPGTEGDTYLKLMRHNISTLVKAMQ